MKRTSMIATAAAVAGITLGAVFGPSLTGNASAQTPSPSASASASASTSPIDSLRTLFLDNLAEALSYFVQVRLQQQIERYSDDPTELDKTPNEINVKLLTALERQLLRDALTVVKDFKKYLIQRYHLTF